MALWTVTTSPENQDARFADARDIAYLLDGGFPLPAVMEPVWCGRCGRVTNGERIETLDVIDRVAASQVVPPAGRDAIHHDPLIDAATERAGHAKEWGKDYRFFLRYARSADLKRR